MHNPYDLISHLLLTAQRHASVSSESQDFLLNLRSLIGTRRCSTSFIDKLQRTACWHTHSKPMQQLVCSCPKPQQSQGEPVKQSLSTSSFEESPLQKNILIGKVASTDNKHFSHGCNLKNDPVTPYPLIHTNNSTHSVAPCCSPHYCQAGLALSLPAGGNRGSLEHSHSSCHSSVHLDQALISGISPLCLGHSEQPTSITPISRTTASLDYMTASSYSISVPSQKPVTSPSSIHHTLQSAVHISPPAPEHTNQSCSGQVPLKSLIPNSDLSMDVQSPSVSPMSPASTQNISSLQSTDLRSVLRPSSLGLPLFPMAAQSCTSRDRDLSHLNDCLHHIISRRTSSPVLMDTTARQPGSSHRKVTIYNLPIHDIQSLGSSPTTQHKAPDAPFSVAGSIVGQDFMVCQKMETLPLIPEDMSPIQG